MSGLVRWRCATCGEIFGSWAAAQRHADGHGGARLEWQCENEESEG